MGPPEVRGNVPSAEIEIAAPLTEVWDTLLDGAAYGQWNSFILDARGDMTRIGERIDLRVRLGGRVVRPAFATTQIAPPRQGAAIWVHRYAQWPARWGLICSERRHELVSTNEGTMTHYSTHEVFWGALHRFVPFAAVDAGFKRQALDLKRVCEAVTNP